MPVTRSSPFKSVGHTALHRISFFCIIMNPGTTLPLVSASLRSLPSLESLLIASAQAIGNLYEPLSALMNIVGESSTTLTSLYLDNVNVNFILRASTKTFWTRSIQIAIRNELDTLDASLFSIPPNLAFLFFSGELAATPAPFTAHLDSALKTFIGFPKVDWLHVSLISMDDLPRLSLLTTRAAGIDCVRGNCLSPTPSLRMLDLSTLTLFQIPAAESTHAANRTILSLTIPPLKQADADNVLNHVSCGAEAARPHHLTFRVPLQDVHLSVVLRFLKEKLVRLELVNRIPFSKFFWIETNPE